MLRKILYVATYPEMLEIANQVNRRRGGEMDIVFGELFEAVRAIQECDLTEREAIVCRGGTAKLLRDSFHLPVVEVEVSAYDILRAVYKYRDRKIAVIGADNVISGVKLVQEVIGLDIYYCPFTFEHEIEEKVKLIRGMDIDVVVGDTVAVRIAQGMGLTVELVRSGTESVEDAVDKAEKICEAILQEREKSSRINAIIEHLNEGIIVTDEHAKIVLFNHVAEKLLHRTRQEMLDKDINYALPNIDIASVIKSGKSVSKQILQLGNAFIVANKIPILVEGKCSGVAITCEDVTEIQKLEQKIRQTLSKRGLVAKRRFTDIIGESVEIKDTITLAKKYAQVDSAVLIYGESGTGKELFAQSIHNYSQRKNGPFIAINCATLPPSLLESTLFGYEEGAFTGAKKGGRKGVFELAHNGTLFLDEITEMDLSIQSKILRVLQEQEVMHLGGDRIVPVNVRIIAASNKKLFSAVDDKQFREDLYYRLSVLNVNIPPLRDRRGDIGVLVEALLRLYCEKYNLPLISLEAGVIRKLEEYSWPGNVRQLENVVQKIVILTEDGLFREQDMKSILLEEREQESDQQESMLQGTLSEITGQIILHVLREEGFNKTKAALRLGITRATLNKHLTTV